MWFAKKHWKQSLFMTYHNALLIPKLFTPFVPICSQSRLYIYYLGEFIKNKGHRFWCFSTNDVIIRRVYKHLHAANHFAAHWIHWNKWKISPYWCFISGVANEAMVSVNLCNTSLHMYETFQRNSTLDFLHNVPFHNKIYKFTHSVQI